MLENLSTAVSATSLSDSTQKSPYRQRPPKREQMFSSTPTYRVATVDKLLRGRHSTLLKLKENLSQAQARMKFYADRKKTEREFQIGDEVYLKLKPYRQTSIALRKSLKLNGITGGPLTVIERISIVAYKLKLPPRLFDPSRLSCVTIQKEGEEVYLLFKT